MRTILVTVWLAATVVTLVAETAAGIRWTAPTGWTVEAPRPMRAATYSLRLAPGDQGVAECVVNYFGPGQGGGVDANVERWKSQVLGPDGKPALPKIDKRTVQGLPVVVIDSSGAYTGLGGPMVTAPKPVPGYRLLGAIVEAPGGTVFFKLTGPAKTIGEHLKGFNQLLGSIQLAR